METVLLTSLGKIFPDRCVGSSPARVSIMRNERYSFQLAYRLDEGACGSVFSLGIDSSLPVTEYRIGYVPVLNACPAVHDSGFDRTDAGLYPDPLFRRAGTHRVENRGVWGPLWLEDGEPELLNAVSTVWQGLWITVNEDEKPLPPGEHAITIRLFDSFGNKEIARESLVIHVIDAMLPPQSVICTNWFHIDCLADHYGEEPFSDKGFAIIGSFMREAAANGQNMIMLPAFTPPLDTPVGTERRTVQLVRVEKSDGKYKFDFTLFERYIKLAQSCGIEYFEHSHMFTQWGAEHAPKITVSVNGEERRLFGWGTAADDPEYISFLSRYFAEMLPVAEKLGVKEKIWYHISDEPDIRQIGAYSSAASLMRSLTDGGTLFDALSNYGFAKSGTTDIPVVTVESEDLPRFIADGKPFWIYNTGAEIKSDYPSRLISNSSVRNRMLGVIMYSIGAQGYLNWGYNYYYDILSHGRHDPNCYTGTYLQRPGASYIVYPSADGTARPSLRMKVFHEAMSDFRALSLLESLTSRETVKAIIHSHFGDLGISYPMTEEELLAFRSSVNTAIADTLRSE